MTSLKFLPPPPTLATLLVANTFFRFLIPHIVWQILVLVGLMLICVFIRYLLNSDPHMLLGSFVVLEFFFGLSLLMEFWFLIVVSGLARVRVGGTLS